MAYTDDAVKAKLSALNETQEGIVTVAQWIMFHRRHADRTAQLWAQRLKDSTSSKRLNMIYLANEVVQQSKARRKNEFVNAFAPIIPDATSVAYKGATYDIQQKIRRVIEVWRQRQIFELQVQESIESRVDEIDRSRGTGKKAALGGSLFSSSGPSAPPELQPIIPLQTALTKAELAAQPSVTTANEEYAKITDPATPIPTPPMHAARLNAILKSLANAEGAVAESIKARRALIIGLEKLLDTHRTALSGEESQQYELNNKRTTIETRKREVEDSIMRGLSAETPTTSTAYGDSTPEPARPDVEQLTPPPVEALTPVGSPPSIALPPYEMSNETEAHEQPIHEHEQPPQIQETHTTTIPIPGADLLASLTTSAVHPRHTSEENINGSAISSGGTFKRRKLGGNLNDEFAEFTAGEPIAGIDADVAEMLGRE